MDDQTKGVDLDKTSSEQKPKKTKSESNKSSKPNKFQEIISEYKRVIWTPKRELFKQTGTVITVSIMVGIIIYIIDIAFGTGYRALFSFFAG